MAIPLPCHFWSWYNHLLSTSSRISEIQNFLFQHVKDFKLDEVKTMISIGAGKPEDGGGGGGDSNMKMPRCVCLGFESGPIFRTPSVIMYP